MTEYEKNMKEIPTLKLTTNQKFLLRTVLALEQYEKEANVKMTYENFKKILLNES